MATEESLAVVLDGVRAVQQACNETIVFNASRDDGDRSVVCACADVEEACLSVLGGVKLAAATPTPGPRNLLNPMSLLSAAKPLQDMFKMGGTAAAPPPEGTAGGAGADASLRHGLSSYTPLRLSPSHLAPVTDVIVLHGDDGLPPGFVKVSCTVTGAYPADLNAGSGSRQLHLAVARSPGAPPLTSLALVALELGEFIPPGYVPVRRAATGRPSNLRHGTPASELVLCVSRAPGAPILDVGLLFPAGAMVLLPKLPGGLGPKGGSASAWAAPSTTGGGSSTDAPARIVSAGGTLASLEAAEAARGRTGLLTSLGMGGFRDEVRALVAALGPVREALPVGYAALSTTLLGAAPGLAGGSARGGAVLVYVKDMTHVEALGDATSLLPLARVLLRGVVRDAEGGEGEGAAPPPAPRP
jgi:hypothetical protein